MPEYEFIFYEWFWKFSSRFNCGAYVGMNESLIFIWILNKQKTHESFKSTSAACLFTLPTSQMSFQHLKRESIFNIHITPACSSYCILEREMKKECCLACIIYVLWLNKRYMCVLLYYSSTQCACHSILVLNDMNKHLKSHRKKQFFLKLLLQTN